MTDFEIDAIYNTICRPGRVVRIQTKGDREGYIPVMVWKRWTIMEVHRRYVVMKSVSGYLESFSTWDIRNMIKNGGIRWR